MDRAWDSTSLRSGSAREFTFGSRMTKKDIKLGLGWSSLQIELIVMEMAFKDTMCRQGVNVVIWTDSIIGLHLFSSLNPVSTVCFDLFQAFLLTLCDFHYVIVRMVNRDLIRRLTHSY